MIPYLHCPVLFRLLIPVLLATLIAVWPQAIFAQLNEAGQQALSDSDRQKVAAGTALPELIAEASEAFEDIRSADLDPLLTRIGDARVVLLGESTHGTAEFYAMRAQITRALIEHRGFNLVAVEADWPDASRIDYFIRSLDREPGYNRPMFQARPFDMFPEWMWRNDVVADFTLWLRQYNRSLVDAGNNIGFYGLDLYNLYGSIDVVLDYLYLTDPSLAEYARHQYSCLSPWQDNPSRYGRDMRLHRHPGCEQAVKAVAEAFPEHPGQHGDLSPLIKSRPNAGLEARRYFSAWQNVRLIVNGERYFRTLYDDSEATWNQRDRNMFDTLQAVIKHRGKDAKVVVWAQNIHIGDARATDMADTGEINLGQLVREAYGKRAYLIGFGTDHGSVAAAPGWGKAVERMRIPPSNPASYEYLFHQTGAAGFLLPLGTPQSAVLREQLLEQRLERAIGVAYDPARELKKHYYKASLPEQFDEYIWIDETSAVRPLYK